MAKTREATHAGSWYTDDGPALSKQLDGFLNRVDQSIEGIGPIPQPGARVIIAPYVYAPLHLLFQLIVFSSHAGYSYSGPAAAWAYKSLDLSQA